MWKKWIGDNWQPSVPVSAVRVNVAKE
jgi:hypothetical protein